MKYRLSLRLFRGLQPFLKGLMINIMIILFLLTFGGGPVQAATGIPPTGSMITLTAVNGQYVSAANNDNTLIANQQTAGDDETFEVVDAGSGKVGLKCLGNGQYVCAESSGNDALAANRNNIGAWETFTIKQSGDKIGFVAYINGKYVCAENNGKNPLIANRTHLGSYGQFSYTIVGGKAVNLLTGEQLYQGDYLESVNGQYRFKLQGDGNLVLKDWTTQQSLWSSRTNGKGGIRLKLQDDGNLVLRKSSGESVWSSKTNTTDADELRLNNDGSLVLYKNGTEVWAVNKFDGNLKPTLKFIAPSSGDVSSDIGVVVDASDPDGEITKVLLYIDDTFVRQESHAPYNWGTANTNNDDAALLDLAPGTYQLRAEAFDNHNAKSTATLSVTIGDDNDKCLKSNGCYEIEPSGTSNDSDTIQKALNRLNDGETLQLNGDFLIRNTIYLPSNITWILNGSLTLGDNSGGNLDRIGVVEPGVDSRQRTGITEKPGGATNIDMSGGIYYGNAKNNASHSVRFINFIRVSQSKFHHMTIDNASDDNFTLGAKSKHNECRQIISKNAGANSDNTGNGLTDRGDYNKWYDCIAEDCLSDGWTPKCRNSEFYRCIGRRNLGPGFGLYCRLDGSSQDNNIAEVITGNKFYACEAYDNYRGGISFDISANSGEGAIIRDNFVQGKFYNNRMNGVLFRNKTADGIVEDNVIDILVYQNKGEKADGSPSSIGGGLSVDGDRIKRIKGSVVAYKNGSGGGDIELGKGRDCEITVYNPKDQRPAKVDDGHSSNDVDEVDFDCADALETWSMRAYCK